ncbi:glycosyltransferase [bacterium]|nr:glycosyltransferase [bacterium]
MKRRKGYLKLRKELLNSGIDFRVRLMPAAQAWQWFAIPLFILFCLPVLLSHLAKGGFDIVHARSYAAGLLALISAKLLKIKCVFDPRGPFPEEMVIGERWNRNGITHRIWCFSENILIKKSDAVIGVTPQFREEFNNKGAKKSVFVPSRVDLTCYPTSVRMTDFKTNLVFAGESTAAWYKPERFAIHYLGFKKHKSDLKLSLFSRMNSVIVKNMLQKYNIIDSDWSIEACLPEQVPQKLQNSGLGLITGISVEKGWSSWPVKYAECLAAGVPVAVEAEVGVHITETVKRRGLGVVIDMDNPESYKKVIEIFKNRAEYGERCINYAKQKLPIAHSALQYVRLYKMLLKG